MKNFDFKEKQFQISNPIESYFEYISSSAIKNDIFISTSREILKNYDK